METSPLLAVTAGPDLLGTLQRVWGEGAAVLVLPPGLPEAARAETLARLRPTGFLEDGGAVTSLPGEPVADGIAVVLQTSGTTGTPKGVCLSHRALRAAAAASCERLGAEPGDAWLACVPLHHVAGLGILVRSLHLGSTPEVHQAFEPDRVAGSGAEYVSLVPTMLTRLLDGGVDVARFKAILLGGARIPSELLDRAADAGATVVRSYGMTETCGGIAYEGVPLSGVELRIEPDGRIAVAGPSLMDGYRHDGSGIEDGWFVTSDLGRLEDGRLQVLGRTDDVITTGGEKVAPAPLEALLREHPGVSEACVVGVPDERWGERVVAFLVPSGEGTRPSEADIRAHLEPRVSGAHLIPKRVIVLDSLPRNDGGGPDRAALRRRAET